MKITAALAAVASATITWNENFVAEDSTSTVYFAADPATYEY